MLKAAQLLSPLIVDGLLTENAWKAASAAMEFRQQYPNHGKPASFRTEVRVLYDEQYLYVGARMFHDPKAGRVTRLVHRRDRDSASDWFGVALDSLHDRRTAFEFRVNAAGVQRDVLIHSDNVSDDTWDAVWDSGAAVDENGWTAELKIPLSVLRVRAGSGAQIWGINFVRIDQSPQETDRWHLVARSENAFVSRFPELTDLRGLKPQLRREIIPYTSVQGKFATAQEFDDRGISVKAGMDAHIGISSSSLLDLTFMPDFGQTEVDQVILNLSTLETFLPEKRTFFLEGTEIFQVNGPQLFYSRRIGQAAPYPQVNEDEVLLERPLALDIIGAAKFTGKYENGLNLGVLLARTEAEYATLLAADGQPLTRQVKPGTSNGVVRALKQFGDDGSYAGGFLSIYNEDGESGSDRRAWVGAVDGTWKSQNRSMQLNGVTAFSVAEPPEGAYTGIYGQANGIKRWDGGLYISSAVTWADPKFDPNDLGYLARADEQAFRVETGRQWDRVMGNFRNWAFYASWNYSRDFAGRPFNKNLDGRLSTEFLSGWSAYLGGGTVLPVYDDLELRTFYDPVKKYLRRPIQPYITTGVANASSSPWNVQLDLSADLYEDGPAFTATLGQTIRPSSRLEFELSTEYVQSEGELRWLETQDDTPIVGLRRLRQVSQVLRTSYAFTPKLTVQIFSQLFLASWNYRDLQSYVDENTLVPGATSDTTAFNERDLNLHLMLRWELGPGSALYAVYTHGASNFDLHDRTAALTRENFPVLLAAPSDDVFQVKLSWMFR